MSRSEERWPSPLLDSGFTQENKTTKRRTAQRIDEDQASLSKFGLDLTENLLPSYFLFAFDFLITNWQRSQTIYKTNHENIPDWEFFNIKWNRFMPSLFYLNITFLMFFLNIAPILLSCMLSNPNTYQKDFFYVTKLIDPKKHPIIFIM